ncbi:isochorismatase family cysteine hydrolase [Stenotrophomonas maltophilia]|uniref:Amidase n=2 Tax=Lysobacteraceae TaxID=32033 RepID=B2FRJ0_STRMK|nr:MULTISPECIES: isochorismatase family cysteine hydrolase [Stenotrophomonas]EKU9962796.1 cysteine hydrolase [Stenotrophomonas maltophilia]MBA0336263.1 cysteine hydrolase [Stenotrophomonas maltophilia]MBA0539929.1 cysteine hydrolase [Stenotrophomonas maltophilia]MBH1740780.1 cysteine hydrolase [Stenotrophomonas maltophilia]MBY8923581.1 cysteine hydrolase [Stenotrophomonas maltophilia]
MLARRTMGQWKSPTHSQIRANDKQLFAKGSWGGTFHPYFGPQEGDLVVSEHFYQSGFANTDLAMQLNQRGLSNIILIGMIANTCIETTGKYGAEQGFNVTLVSDAMAAYSLEAQHNAIAVNGPTYAHAIYSTEEILARIPQKR